MLPSKNLLTWPVCAWNASIRNKCGSGDLASCQFIEKLTVQIPTPFSLAIVSSKLNPKLLAKVLAALAREPPSIRVFELEAFVKGLCHRYGAKKRVPYKSGLFTVFLKLPKIIESSQNRALARSDCHCPIIFVVTVTAVSMDNRVTEFRVLSQCWK